MSSFDSSVGRRPARSTGAPDTLTHAPRLSPDLARGQADRRARRTYAHTADQLRRARANGLLAMRRPGVGKHR